jgi:4-amino-4-deoxychorismate lyase
VLDPAVHIEAEVLGGVAVAQIGDVLAGDGVQPAQPLRAVDGDNEAVRAVDDRHGLGRDALFTQRIPVVPGDRGITRTQPVYGLFLAGALGCRRRAGTIEQRTTGNIHAIRISGTYSCAMADRLLVNLNGEVLDPDTPMLTADDVGEIRGDGVFETLLVREGELCNLARHLARLANSAKMLELPDPDPTAWQRAAETAAEQWGDRGEGMMRWVLTRGREDGETPTAFITVAPVADRIAGARADGVTVMTLQRGHSVDPNQFAPWLLRGAKTLSYATNMAALRFAQRNHVDDVIFLSSERRVLEGPRSTVVIVRGDHLLTPPVSHGILPGTTQQAMFAHAEEFGFTTEVKSLLAADLITADGVYLVSSVGLAVRVRELDGLKITPPECATRIAELVDSAIRNNQ